MKLTLWIVLALFSVPTIMRAQTPDEQIKEVITRLFKGMQLGDSAMVRTVFHKATTLATAFRARDNTPVLRREASVDGFLKAIGTPHEEAWNEEIWGLEIRTDGDLAQAWCNYAFYAGKNFIHCGVNTFLLHKDKEEWKIFHLADTRRPADCSIPKEISDKYK